MLQSESSHDVLGCQVAGNEQSWRKQSCTQSWLVTNGQEVNIVLMVMPAEISYAATLICSSSMPSCQALLEAGGFTDMVQFQRRIIIQDLQWQYGVMLHMLRACCCSNVSLWVVL